MGLLIPIFNINDIIIDKFKVDKAKTKVKTTAQQKHDKSMENLTYIAVEGSVAESISESTPQMNFSLMRASKDNQRQWKGQRGKVTNQQEW